MKKFLAFILLVFLFASCAGEKDMTCTYRIEYTVFYPDHPSHKTYTFTGDETAKYSLSSARGTNYFTISRTNTKIMKDGYFTLESTTAPIEVIMFKRIN